MTKHSRERAQQRYNIELSKADECNIINILRSGRGIPLDTDTKEEDLSFAYVKYNNIPLKVLYSQTENRGVRSIITVYPFNVEEYNEAQEQFFQEQIKIAIKFLERNGYTVTKNNVR